MPVGEIHKAGELESGSILVLKNENKLQNVDAWLLFSSIKIAVFHIIYLINFVVSIDH